MAWFIMAITTLVSWCHLLAKPFITIYNLAVHHAQQTDVLIELPVTTPKRSVSYVASGKIKQCFITSPLTPCLLSVTKFWGRFVISPLVVGYSSVTATLCETWHKTVSYTTAYIKRALESIPSIDLAFIKELGSGIRRFLRIGSKGQDSSPFTEEDRNELGASPQLCIVLQLILCLPFLSMGSLIQTFSSYGFRKCSPTLWGHYNL